MYVCVHWHMDVCNAVLPANCGIVRQAVYSARETTWTSQQLRHHSNCFSEHLPASHPPLRAVLANPLTNVDLSGLASRVVALIFAWFWFCLLCCCSNTCLVFVSCIVAVLLAWFCFLYCCCNTHLFLLPVLLL